jgi:ribosomal protein L7Ae-like RNA K-turn-binding protein
VDIVVCTAGGLDEALHAIIQMCQVQQVPFIFALGRRALGRACAKPVPVSVVGIFSYEGVEVCSKTFRSLQATSQLVFKRKTVDQ